MLLTKTLNKDCKIYVFLTCLLSIVDIENSFIICRLILEQDMLSYKLLITALNSFFTIS